MLGSTAGQRLPASSSPIVQRHPQLLIHLHLRDARLDTLFSSGGAETYDGLRVPFGRQALIAATDTLLYMADTGEAEFRILGLDGVTRRIVRLALAVRATTRADVERIREQYLGGLPPDLLAQVQSRFDAVPIPPTMPHFSQLKVAPDGTVWLQAYQPFPDEEVTRWFVVDPEGRWLGEVDLPPRFAVHEIGVIDVIGIWRDDFDVEYIRRYAILP